MVRVIDQTEEAWKMKEKGRQVRDMATRFFDGCDIVAFSSTWISVRRTHPYGDTATIYFTNDWMHLRDPNYLTHAKRFAQEYERTFLKPRGGLLKRVFGSLFNEEFRIQTEYDNSD